MAKRTLHAIPLFLKTSRKKQGAPPGAMIHVGKERNEPVTVTAWVYDVGTCTQKHNVSPEALPALAEEARARHSVLWVNVSGLHDPKIIEAIGEAFALHPLLLEDVVNTAQRPKMEEFEESMFVVAKMMRTTAGKSVDVEQISFVLSQGVLLSFQECQVDPFAPIRERLEQGTGKLRERKADYLFYRLLDAIVDEYFGVIGMFGERLEELEERIAGDRNMAPLTEVHGLRRSITFLRRTVWPLRDVVSHLSREESDLIARETLPYLNDVHDHVIQAVDATDTFRDILSGIHDNHLSLLSHRMNEVMKVLTIMGSIFIPLTFIAGIYGMNFQHMPELAWPNGYPVVLAVMAGIAGVMVLFFRRKGWL